MKLLSISPEIDYLLIPDMIWDGISPDVYGAAVNISRGIITRIIPLCALREETWANMEIIHLTGLTLMPGMVDCHVHFSMDGENLLQAITNWDLQPDLVTQKACQAAMDYLSAGVLAVRDGGDNMNIGLSIRNSINKGLIPGPLVTATGRAIFRRGRYGAFLGPGVGNLEEALSQLELFRDEGIDQLKVVVSGLVSFKEFGTVGPVQFSVTELQAIVDKAHSLGLKVMAHASSAPAVETAVRAGVDSVEHGYFLQSRQLELMARRGTAWIPTLAPLGNLIHQNHLPYEGADMNVIRRTFEIQLVRVKEAYDMGITLGIGTDAGANHVPHGSSYTDELNYYALAGLNIKAILQIAIAQSACILGRGQELGTVSEGKKPFLIGVCGSPFASINRLKNPEMVILPGR